MTNYSITFAFLSRYLDAMYEIEKKGTWKILGHINRKW